MTFPDQEAVAQNCCQMASGDKVLTGALKTALQQAHQDGRLTYGAYDCAKLLELAHESVMMCVLARSENPDVTVVIQHTLMEAFCLEQGIPLLKVGSDKQLADILCTCDLDSPSVSEGPWKTHSVSCALLQARPKGLTKAEKTLCELYGKSVSGIPVVFPVIELNV